MNTFLKWAFVGILSLYALNSFAQKTPNPGYIEGMWIPNTVAQLKGEEMTQLGLKISPDSIYKEDGVSLKDAIVSLNGGGCTAGAISSSGLLITNHHCAYDEVASISTPEKDYLGKGFWPRTLEEEIPLEGMTASFLVRIENVTDKVMADGEGGMEAAMNALAEEAEQEGLYMVDIAEMYHGLEYYLYVYEVFTDVRLAGVPPQDIGKFGYDTDNWMWPRHTGDFALLRVYAGQDNRPAEYAPENKPYQPKYHFPVTTEGIEKDDFTMIMGYPGSTTRYLTSYAVSHLINKNYPDHIKMREISTTAMKEAMGQSEAQRLQLSGDYASLMNYYKYFKGASTMLKRNKIVEQRQAFENAFQQWAEADPERKEKYGNVLKDIAELHEIQVDADHINQYLLYAAAYPGAASKVMQYTLANIRRLNAVMERGSKEMQEGEIERLKEVNKEFYANFLREMDKKIYLGHLEAMFTDLREEIRPEMFDEIAAGQHSFPMSEEEDLSKKEKRKLKKQARKNRKLWNAMTDEERFLAWADTAYDRSLAGNPQRLNEFLEDPDGDVLSKDPILILLTDILKNYTSKAALVLRTFNSQIGDLRKTYIKGMMEMQPERTFYPDANSTTRFSYGKVMGYSAGDSVEYDHYTTTKGILEKYDPENPDYQVPARLLELINGEEYDAYADKDGSMHVCFLSTNDITGGNSGSPVLNGKGQLIGVAFDGNWESMCGDVEVLKEVNRTIVADIRYVLFIVDKFGGAKRLIEEMTIAK